MNNEPVGLTQVEIMNALALGIPLYTHPVNPYQSITNTKIEPTVVSYTHPVKEQLTNTEIADALYVADITLDNLSDGDIPIERINAFARAVIRKAQEK